MGVFGDVSKLDRLFDLRGSGMVGSANITTSNKYIQIFRADTQSQLTGVQFRSSDITSGPVNAVFTVYAASSYLTPTGDPIATGTFSISTSNAIYSRYFDAPVPMVKGNYYCLVLTNGSANPETSYFKIGYTPTANANVNGTWRYTTDGANYGVLNKGSIFFLLFDYGKYDMYQCVYSVNDAGSGPALYNVDSSRLAYAANKYNFTNSFELYSVFATIGKSGSPNYGLVCEVLNGDNESLAISKPTKYTNNNHGAFIFANPIALYEGKIYYIAFRAETLGTVGNSSNYYTIYKSQYDNYGKLPPFIYDAYSSTAWASRSWSAYINGDFLGLSHYGRLLPPKRYFVNRG